ncbi:alpha/beta fold hydrolase [Massilia pseudoviolaceinigra]|uniref:alpha/beta fold hydrolase n=1 Tax=Massilia pseudoviolaceinigra TaxID=3057165 RepID=UPI002796A879|nr:alpha/beta fold hydrolase [Massilia sp. CCM 9206]MDQ1921616.1 alpha/beta fold hydrolase [Massilia sp. CCM 9206]
MSSWTTRLSDRLLAMILTAECKSARLETASVAVNGGRFAYLRRGSSLAEAIVMLHGAASDKSAWLRLAKYMRTDMTILIPDLPGHGESTAAPASGYDIQAQTDGVLGFLAALGVGRAHVIGNSMGGAIALRMAADSPDSIASLVLIDAAGAETSPSWLRQQFSESGINPMVAIRSTADYKKMIGIGMEKPPYIPGFLLGALARNYIAREEINQRIARDVDKDLDQRHVLGSISARSLIIWGAQDKVVHVDDAQTLHTRLRNSEKVVLDGIGHVPMVEAPKKVADLCDAFYAGLPAPRLAKAA